jgi:predicted nucleic acid-binding protein
LRSRTLEAANQAASLKQQAWAKDSQSTWASARAAELEAEAAGFRIRGDLGGALRTVKEANRLHDEADEAAEEAEALRAEAKQKESEADDASKRAIDAISRSTLLGAANANKEAKEAEERAVSSRLAYSELLKQLGMAMKQLEDARALQVEAAERLRDAQMLALASRLGGGVSVMSQEDSEEERIRRVDVQKASALVASLEGRVTELNAKMQEARSQGTINDESSHHHHHHHQDLSSSSSPTFQATNQQDLFERFEALARISFDAAKAAEEAKYELQAQADDMKSRLEAFRSSIDEFER